MDIQLRPAVPADRDWIYKAEKTGNPALCAPHPRLAGGSPKRGI